MKKLIFLLLMTVVLGGFLFAANPVHPPGEFFLDVTLSENNIHEDVIASDSVLVLFLPVAVEQSIIQAVLAHDNLRNFAIQPHNSDQLLMPTSYRQSGGHKAVDYDLRC